MIKPAIPALPTSELCFALADIITAPSTPKKQNKVTIIVLFTCVTGVFNSDTNPHTSLLNRPILKNTTKTIIMNKSMTTLTHAKRVLTSLAVFIP